MGNREDVAAKPSTDLAKLIVETTQALARYADQVAKSTDPSKRVEATIVFNQIIELLNGKDGWQEAAQDFVANILEGARITLQNEKK